MRDIQDSRIYVEFLQLLSGGRSHGLAAVQFIDFLCERDSASIPEFIKVTPEYDRAGTYQMVKKLVKLGVVEKIPKIPVPSGFEDWGSTRKTRWNSKNRGANRFRLSLDTAMKTIDGKIQDLESFRERLKTIKDFEEEK